MSSIYYILYYDAVGYLNTLKEYQGKGIGGLMMKNIVNWYESIKDDDTYLYLGASQGKEEFYKKFGFKERPYGHIGSGMKYDPD